MIKIVCENIKNNLLRNWCKQKEDLEKRDIENIHPRVGEIWLVKL